MARRRAQLVYKDAERAFTEGSKSLLTNALNPLKWWFIVKTVDFGASSSLPPLIDKGSKLVWAADEISAALLLVTLLRHCVLLPSGLALFALLDLDSYGGNDYDCMFPLFTSRWLGKWHLSWL